MDTDIDTAWTELYLVLVLSVTQSTKAKTRMVEGVPVAISEIPPFPYEELLQKVQMTKIKAGSVRKYIFIAQIVAEWL